MAKKRDRKPQEPQIEETELLKVFEDPETPVERETYPEPVPVSRDRARAEGSEEAAMRSLFGTPDAEPPAPAVPAALPSTSDPPATSVDDYVRSQVLREMYGTDTPSDYDKISLALKRML